MRIRIRIRTRIPLLYRFFTLTTFFLLITAAQTPPELAPSQLSTTNHISKPSHVSTTLTPQVVCFAEATSYEGLNLSSDYAILLCRNAADSTPIDCFSRAYAYEGLNLSRSYAAYLCSESTSADEQINCVSQAIAYRGLNLSTGRAVRLCSKGTLVYPTFQ